MAEMEPEIIKIHVKELSGDTMSVEIEKNAKVKELKAKIEATNPEYKKKHQRILFRGRELKGRHPLNEYKVEEESCLHIIKRIRHQDDQEHQQGDANNPGYHYIGEDHSNDSDSSEETDSTDERNLRLAGRTMSTIAYTRKVKIVKAYALVTSIMYLILMIASGDLLALAGWIAGVCGYMGAYILNKQMLGSYAIWLVVEVGIRGYWFVDQHDNDNDFEAVVYGGLIILNFSIISLVVSLIKNMSQFSETEIDEIRSYLRHTVV